MKTIRQLRTETSETIIPNGYTLHGWSNILPHEMNVLFHALCHVVSTCDTKAEMKKQLSTYKGLEGTFDTLDKTKFQSEEAYEAYISLLNKHKEIFERSNIPYPKTMEEAIKLFTKWGLVINKRDYWDIPVTPFPEVEKVFTLNDIELRALNHLKLEAVVHPIFSKLVLMLHEKDENEFEYSKAELKEMLDIDDAMLTEVLIKLTPYMAEAIENFQAIPDDEKMEFAIVWERIYEDFLGTANPQALQ